MADYTLTAADAVTEESPDSEDTDGGGEISDGTSEEEIGSFASKMNALGGGLESFSGSIKEIKEDDVKAAEYALTMLTTIGERASKFGSSWIRRVFVGSTDLTQFGLDIQELGVNVQKFFDAIKIEESDADISAERLQKALMTVESVANAASVISNKNTNSIKQIFQNAEIFAADVATFMIDLGTTTRKIGDTDYTISDLDLGSISQVIGIMKELAYMAATVNQIGIAESLRNFGDALIPEESGKISFGVKIAKFYEYLETVFNNAENPIDIDKVHKSIEGVSLLIDAIRNMYILQTNGTYDVMNGEKSMTALIQGIEYLMGKKDVLQGFVDSFSSFGTSNFDGPMQVFRLVKLMGEAFNEFGKVDYVSNISTVSNGINRLTALDPTLIKNALAPLIESLVEYVNSEDNYEQLTSVGTSIALTIAQGIQAAFDDPTNNDVKIRVTPILEMGDIQKQLQDSGLTGYANGTFTGLKVTLPEDFYEQIKIPDYSSELQGIRTDIGGLNGTIEKLGSDIKGLQIYLNGQKLVGGIINDIQAELNERDFYYVRGLGK